MDPCRTPHMLHLVSHRAQFWDLYSSWQYINDINENIQSSICLFADDSIIYCIYNSNIDHQILQTIRAYENGHRFQDEWSLMTEVAQDRFYCTCSRIIISRLKNAPLVILPFTACIPVSQLCLSVHLSFRKMTTKTSTFNSQHPLETVRRFA